MPKKKTNVAEAMPEAEIQTEAPIETPVEAVADAPAPEAPPKKKARKKKEAAVSGVTTLADLAAAYVVHMENDGKSAGTIASYSMELRGTWGEAKTTALALHVVRHSPGPSKRSTDVREGKLQRTQ